MSEEKLQIRKNGKLYKTKYVYNDETETGSYQEFDVTEKSFRYLYEICDLEENVTLKDIFLLLNSNLDIFDAVIGNWCKEYVVEGLKHPGKTYTGNYDPEEIEFLELRKYITVEKYENKENTTMPNVCDFSGIGFELKEDKLFDWKNEETGTQEVEYSKGSRINWSLLRSELSDLVNIPVKLNNKLEIWYENLDYEEDKISIKESFKKLNEFKNPNFTLGDILYSIMWELSFHGNPKNREDYKNYLKNVCKEFNNNYETHDSK